jgi:hypothetical protein
MGAIAVRQEGNIIHAIYSGAMTMELVRDGQRRIEDLVAKISAPVILYDTLAMDPPPIQLAMEMKAFDGRIRDSVVRSATVVPEAGTAFMAKIAFALSRNHKVFYHDINAAYSWLRNEGAEAMPPRPTI